MIMLIRSSMVCCMLMELDRWDVGRRLWMDVVSEDVKVRPA